MDQILIRELSARCLIGVSSEERRERQEVVVSLALVLDLAPAGHSDRIGDAVDYRTIKKRVLTLIESSQFQLLEALAEAVAAACLEQPAVHEVRVTLDKPGSLRFARSVAVEIVRKRG
jgi:dihydroneopterin aldolase/D-erythro-7,8-dihydroneopterin triphosphate epimerase